MIFGSGEAADAGLSRAVFHEPEKHPFLSHHIFLSQRKILFRVGIPARALRTPIFVTSCMPAFLLRCLVFPGGET